MGIEECLKIKTPQKFFMFNSKKVEPMFSNIYLRIFFSVVSEVSFKKSVSIKSKVGGAKFP